MPTYETTYDGQPIAPDKPNIVCVVVYREAAQGRELLLMHRCSSGPDYEGDWAWTPPAGARWPGEAIHECAHRELREETGLALTLLHAPGDNDVCAVYVGQAAADAAIILNDEHDRFEWVSAGEALLRCKPDVVAEEIRAAMRILEGL
jgi:8-oxo-dGTP diphosphatase